MKRFVALVGVLLIGLCAVAAAQTRTYEIEDLLKVRRVGDPQVSPDGKQVAFTVGDVNFDANRIVTHIYVTSLRSRRNEAVDHRRSFVIIASLFTGRQEDRLHDRRSDLGDG